MCQLIRKQFTRVNSKVRRSVYETNCLPYLISQCKGIFDPKGVQQKGLEILPPLTINELETHENLRQDFMNPHVPHSRSWL